MTRLESRACLPEFLAPPLEGEENRWGELRGEQPIPPSPQPSPFKGGGESILAVDLSEDRNRYEQRHLSHH